VQAAEAAASGAWAAAGAARATVAGLLQRLERVLQLHLLVGPPRLWMWRTVLKPLLNRKDPN
jgi:hypothetical protein